MGQKTFLDHNYAGKPWFAQTEPKLVYSFEVNITSLNVLESETPWGDTFEAEGEFRSICDPEGDEFIEDGELVAPFWVCEALQKAIKEHITNGGKTKGWLQLWYKREVELGENREGKEVEINTAYISLEPPEAE